MTAVLFALSLIPMAFDVTVDFGTIEPRTCQTRNAKVIGAYAGQYMSEVPAKVKAGIVRRMMPSDDNMIEVTLCNASDRPVKVGKHRAQGVLLRAAVEDRMPIVGTAVPLSIRQENGLVVIDTESVQLSAKTEDETTIYDCKPIGHLSYIEDRYGWPAEPLDIQAKGKPGGALSPPSGKCLVFNAQGELISKGDCGPRRVPY